VKQQIAVLLGGGIAVAYLLDTWVGHEFPTLTVSCMPCHSCPSDLQPGLSSCAAAGHMRTTCKT
jgi:hypothetical protein